MLTYAKVRFNSIGNQRVGGGGGGALSGPRAERLQE